MTDNSTDPARFAERAQQEIGMGRDIVPAPVEKWDPPFSGDLDILITRQGRWLYKGNPMTREALVRLFSSILRRDPDGCFYLVTPVEKFRIQVEDAPFVAHSLEVEGEGQGAQLWLRTNVGERIRIDQDHPLHVAVKPQSEEPVPYVRVRGVLDALVERQSFYDLVLQAVPGEGSSEAMLGVYSAGHFFAIGNVEPTHADSAV